MPKNSRTSGPDVAVKGGMEQRPGMNRDGLVEAVMRGAAAEGLTLAKDGRIAGRVSRELIAKAKARTGLQSDTELVEFALATVALDDGFAEAFREVRCCVDPDLDLGL